MIPVLTSDLEQPFRWHARVREKTGAKKEMSYWLRGSELETKEQVAALLRVHYSGVEVVYIEQAKKFPDRKPIMIGSHQHGIIERVERERRGLPLDDQEEQKVWRPPTPIRKQIIAPISAKPIAPLSAKPLSQR